MTAEEAILILATGSKIPDTLHTSEDVDEACRMAVAALRAQRPHTLEECEMCSIQWNQADWADGGAHDFRIDSDALFYFDEQFGWEGIKIKYCPFCGRPLTGEARAELERRIGGNNGTADTH